MLLKKLFHYFHYNKELYGYLPIGILLTLAAIFGLPYLTDRLVIENPGIIVDYLIKFLGAQLVLILVGMMQNHHVYDMTKEQCDQALKDDDFKWVVLDTIKTIVLVFGFLFYFTH